MESTNNSKYPFKYQELTPEETEELNKYYTPKFTSKFIRLGCNGYFLYKEFEDIVLDIYNMELRSSETFVLTFPRSGTTWTQELVWLLQNDCNFKRAKDTPLSMRFPFLESGTYLKMTLPKEMSQNVDFEQFVAENFLHDLKVVKTMPSPRFFKSHLPISLLPPSLLDTAKVVCVARDPRDVVVSNYFHLKSNHFSSQDLEFKSFWDLFVENKVLRCPYFEHVKEAWSQRNHPNMAFIFYEELSEDWPAVARRLAKFFDKEYSEDQYQAVTDHLQFENFKNNDSVNWKKWRDSGMTSGHFIRKGKAGGWREHFDSEMTQQAERWIAANRQDTDLQFPHIL